MCMCMQQCLFTVSRNFNGLWFCKWNSWALWNPSFPLRKIIPLKLTERVVKTLSLCVCACVCVSLCVWRRDLCVCLELNGDWLLIYCKSGRQLLLSLACAFACASLLPSFLSLVPPPVLPLSPREAQMDRKQLWKLFWLLRPNLGFSVSCGAMP